MFPLIKGLLKAMRRVSPIPPEKNTTYVNETFQMEKSDWPQSSEKGPPVDRPGPSNAVEVEVSQGTVASEFKHIFYLGFKDPNLERTFKNYMTRTRHNMTTHTFLLGLSLNISGALTVALSEIDLSVSQYYIIALSACFVFNILALLMPLVVRAMKKDLPMFSTPWILFIWTVFLIQLFGISMTFGSLPVVPGSDMMWITCMCYYSFVLFPLRMRYCLILNLVMFAIHCIIITVVPFSRSYFNVLHYDKTVSCLNKKKLDLHVDVHVKNL